MPRSALADPFAVPSSITADLLAWYDRSRRKLPWRALPGEPSDPYAVWLSEVMLQQTTVQAVKPFFARFLALWPTINDLGAAPVEEVMRAWAGLGYYSRARNLHAAAITVAREHGGRFPETEEGLRALPGIGAYTAAAIAAIAFGRHAVVVDGNVERVMARLHAIEQPPAAVKPMIRARMAALTPATRAGDFAQSVMDLGATICTPKNPACAICPVAGPCRARRDGLQAVLPARRQKKSSPMRHGEAYFIIDADGKVLVRRRPPTGLLGSMVELPGSPWVEVSTEPGPSPSIQHQDMAHAGRVTHTFTHFTLFLDVFAGQSRDVVPLENLTGSWAIADHDLDSEALPTLMRHAVKLGRTAIAATRPAPDPASHRRRRS